MIVGVDNSSASVPGALYRLDPLTGNTALTSGWIWTSGYIATSSAADPNWFFAYSPVDLYRFNLFTGEDFWYPCLAGPGDPCASVRDLAYDSSSQNLYGLGVGDLTYPPSLFRLVEGGSITRPFPIRA